ncbi:ABC transporter permease [Auritidibacter sp. NML120636]|uniref:ABC transporter permease n=1 Tax=Auritidibacter sp. NML120636 TaxID=2170743 RepID=UPI000D73F636|nr:ABC transporter permease [Auritidibacter sp. NML120636]PXA79780.1 nitrate ABC transporter permease [Auritidibacter sp. NML120636]
MSTHSTKTVTTSTSSASASGRPGSAGIPETAGQADQTLSVDRSGAAARVRSGHAEKPWDQRGGRSWWLGTTAGRFVLGLIVPVGLLLVWWGVTAAEVFNPVQLPSPFQVIDAGVVLAERGDLGFHILISLQRVLLGFGIGAALGLVLGAVLGLNRWAEAMLSPILGAIRAVPSLAWVPLLILWLQIGENSKVTLIAIGAFFPVFTTVFSALKHVNPQLVEAGRAFGYHGLRLLGTVQLPAVVPSIFSGLRLALAQVWLFVVAAELIASSMGLGFLLTDSQNNGRTDRLILAIILLAVIGKITDALLGLLEKWAIKRWA